MLDIQFIRENKELVKSAAVNKNRDVNIDRLLETDEIRRELLQQSQQLREERNRLSKQGDTDETRTRGKEIKNELKKIEDDLRLVEEEYTGLMLRVPNVPLEEVPVGKDESANVELSAWGEPRSFDFKPKDHTELGESLDLLDLERGSKISGFRGYFIKNELAQLQMAVMMYSFNKIIQKGYSPCIAPSIVKEFTLYGSGHFPWGREEDVYSLNGDDDAYLSGTAEIPVTAYHSGEMLSEDDLPKKYAALSPCYRREAGAYGKDTKGMFRVHEFWKIEQVVLAPADMNIARELHNELQSNIEEILQDFELPYRTVMMSTGDMGEPQMLKYDTDVWIPSQEAYREIGSNSIFGDFQARRLQIRYKTEDGSTKYVYTLNATAVPSTRILIALMENHQQSDGSISIPEVLRSYTGFDSINP